jgi:hypothetical protein
MAACSVSLFFEARLFQERKSIWYNKTTGNTLLKHQYSKIILYVSKKYNDMCNDEYKRVARG